MIATPTGATASAPLAPEPPSAICLHAIFDCTCRCLGKWLVAACAQSLAQLLHFASADDLPDAARCTANAPLCPSFNPTIVHGVAPDVQVAASSLNQRSVRLARLATKVRIVFHLPVALVLATSTAAVTSIPDSPGRKLAIDVRSAASLGLLELALAAPATPNGIPHDAALAVLLPIGLAGAPKKPLAHEAGQGTGAFASL